MAWFKTIYCGQLHDIDDGTPHGHSCVTLNTKALANEMAGGQPWHQLKGGAKAPPHSVVVVPPCRRSPEDRTAMTRIQVQRRERECEEARQRLRAAGAVV